MNSRAPISQHNIHRGVAALSDHPELAGIFPIGEAVAAWACENA